jgi:hypothetical protein
MGNGEVKQFGMFEYPWGAAIWATPQGLYLFQTVSAKGL